MNLLACTLAFLLSALIVDKFLDAQAVVPGCETTVAVPVFCDFVAEYLTETLLWYVIGLLTVLTLLKSHFSAAPIVKETPVDYSNPPRRNLIRVLNALFGLPGIKNAAFLSLDKEVLKEEAIAAAGGKLTDFGANDFVETALTVLLGSLEKEANLMPFGRLMTHAKLVALLKNRLLIEDLVTTHPEILQQELWPVVVVMGLQRTGTTVLHRLLGGSDPKKLRQVISWEAVSPVPLAGYEDKTVQEEQQARIDIAKGQVNALAYLAPHFFAIHTCDALEPEEDVMLLDVALASQVPEATWWVPTYSKWVETLDNTVPYEYLRKCLLILQWQTQQTNPDNEFQRWVLKTPAHLENTDAITTVFPDAKMIHTHREPAKCMISFASMVAHTYGVFSDVVDAPVLAKHWLQKNVKMVNSARAVRAADPDSKSRYLDIAYEDTRTDPIGTVKKIYAFLGLEFTAEHAANVAKIGESHTQGMYGKHVYKSSDFNLTATQVNDLLQ